MNLRRHLLETATLLAVAVVVALVSNSLASRERKLKLPGDYPNATVVPAAGGSPASSPAGEAAPATATGAQQPAEAPSQGDPPSKKTSGAIPAPALPVAAGDLLSRFPPHPDKPWVEIAGDDAAYLHGKGALFLDARRTKDYEEGHVRGARSLPVWESDVDQKVLALLDEGRDPKQPIVLYCSGGDCEDSHLLGQKLFGAGFGNLLVYRDGFPDWARRGGTVARGANP